MALEKKIFTGGLDFDTEDRFVAQGDYRHARNGRAGITESGNEGVIEYARGNKLIPKTLFLGQNKIIGAYDDKPNRRIIYLLWHSSGSHQVLQYYYDTETIVPVLVNDLLGFEKDRLITHIDVIDDNQLYWTDDGVEPSHLELDRAINNQYPAPFKRQYLDAIPYAPLCGPFPTYKTDLEVATGPNPKPLTATNNVRGKLFQFAYRWLYPDGRRSAYSPVSKLATPYGEWFDVTGDLFPIWTNNYIEVKIEDTGDKYVNKIELAAREGNFGDWFSVIILDKESLNIPSNSTHFYKFFNNETYQPMDQKESPSGLLYSFIPRKAATQERIEGNRLAYGNILENYDIADVLKEMQEKGTKAEPVYIFPQTLNNPTITIFTATGQNPAFFIGNSVQANNYWSIKVTAITAPPNPTSHDRTFVVLGKAGDTNATIAADFANQIHQFLQGIPVGATASSSGGQINISVPLFPTYTVILSNPKAQATAITIKSFKAGARHPFGIIYSDEKGRVSTVLTTDEMVMYVKYFTEPNHLKGNTEAKITINHKPPDWATKYQIMYARNQSILIGEGGKQQFIQFTTDAVVAGAVAGQHKISLKPILDYAEENSNSVLSYDIAKGDRIRFIKDKTGINYYTEFKETEILFFDSGTNEITVNASGLGNLGAGMLFELYTPKKEVAEKLWFEIGECFDIGDPGLDTRYHKGNTQDQSFFQLIQIVGSIGANPAGTPWNPAISPNQYITNAKLAWDNNVYPPNFITVSVGDQVIISTGIYAGTHTIVHIPGIINQLGHVVLDTPYIGPAINVPVTIKKFIDTPALVRINEGDVYFKSRTMRVTSGPNTYTTQLVEEHHFSDFYTSNYTNFGRPNKVDDSYREIRRGGTIYYTEPYVPDTNINGLGTVFDDSFEEYDKNYGDIKHLFSMEKHLIVRQELKAGQVLVNETYYADLQGGTTIGASESILGPMIYYMGEFGIGNHPESFENYGFRSWNADAQRGVVVRLSQDGFTDLTESEYRAQNYFRDILTKNSQSAVRRPILGVYDKDFEEYLLAIQYEEYIGGKKSTSTRPVDANRPPQTTPEPATGQICLDNPEEFAQIDIVNGKVTICWTNNDGSKSCVEANFVGLTEDGKCVLIDYQSFKKIRTGTVSFVNVRTDTIALSEAKKRWVMFYDFAPDFMVSAGTGLVTFKDGQLYHHNRGDKYGNFYGVQYALEVSFVANEEPSSNKFFKSISIESASDDWEMPQATTQEGQKTSLVKADFERIENVTYAAFWKDENTNVDNPLIEGDSMRSHSMVVSLKNTSDKLVKLFSAGIKYALSELTNR